MTEDLNSHGKEQKEALGGRGTKRAVIIILLLVFILSFAGCGGQRVNGTYVWHHFSNYTAYTFSQNIVKVQHATHDAIDLQKTGKFSIDGTKVNITYEDGSEETLIYDKNNDTLDVSGGLGYVILTK